MVEQDKSLVVSGIGMSQPAATGGDVFIPRLNNAYEKRLHNKARRKTPVKGWRVSRFSKHDFPRSPYQNPYVGALEAAFLAAMRSAGLYRKISKKNADKVGLIYLDFFGPTSSLSRPMPTREMLFMDVFPSFLLQAHGITGFSARKRGERNATAEAIDMAFTLIQSGILDTVIIGGIHQCFSYLMLTETLASFEWAKTLYGNKLPPVADAAEHVVERSLFLVLDSRESLDRRKMKPTFFLEEPSFYTFEENHDNLVVAWKREWRALAGSNVPQHCYGGVFCSPPCAEQERRLMQQLFPASTVTSIGADYGDSGGLNLLLPLYSLLQTPEQPGHAGLMHSFDRNRQGWNLRYRFNVD